MPQHHVVVDGSNLATEGRSLPSLHQLNDAVLAFIAEHPDWLVTVVADATFGHRIDKAEVADFDAAVANNEIVCPPAGAVGRGDAFVLSIAHKVGATILSNDSYQEFHGTYPWLFDEGRLIGGKPVPHVGWVFVTRTPVRGVTSRKAVADAKRKSGKAQGAALRASRPSAEASQPMPVPKTPPPGRSKPVATRPEPAPPATPAAAPAGESHKQSAVHAQVNELMTFLTFVERHPVGAAVTGVVDHYSSHGAYVRIGEVVGYVPLRLMGDPAPRSARDVMKVGDEVALVVDSFAPGRRSIDLATAAFRAPSAPAAPAKPRRTRASAAGESTSQPAPSDPPDAVTSGDDRPATAPGRRRRGAAAAAEPAPVAEAQPDVVAPKPSRRARQQTVAAPAEPSTAQPEEASPVKPASRRRARSAVTPPDDAAAPPVAPATAVKPGTRRRAAAATADPAPAPAAPAAPGRARRRPAVAGPEVAGAPPASAPGPALTKRAGASTSTPATPSAPKSAPKSAQKSTPKAAQKSTPKAAPKPAPSSAARRTPKPATTPVDAAPGDTAPARTRPASRSSKRAAG